MSHKSLWFQGRSPYVFPKCDGRIPQTCPASKTIAAEYARGYFTLTNVLNPNTTLDDIGVESAQKLELSEVKVGDYLWMVLVPPMHRILDYFAYNERTYTENSDLLTMGGISLILVSGTFKAENADGECEVSNEVELGTITFPNTPNPQQQMLVVPAEVINPIDSWTGVGFKVAALPTKRNLADIVGKIAIGCHALDYGAQTFM